MTPEEQRTMMRNALAGQAPPPEQADLSNPWGIGIPTDPTTGEAYEGPVAAPLDIPPIEIRSDPKVPEAKPADIQALRLQALQEGQLTPQQYADVARGAINYAAAPLTATGSGAISCQPDGMVFSSTKGKSSP